jgi:hypothetical protein
VSEGEEKRGRRPQLSDAQLIVLLVVLAVVMATLGILRSSEDHLLGVLGVVFAANCLGRAYRVARPKPPVARGLPDRAAIPEAFRAHRARHKRSE